MKIERGLIFDMNFRWLGRDLSGPLEHAIGRPIRYFACRAVLWRAVLGILLIGVVVLAMAPGSWHAVGTKAFDSSSLADYSVAAAAVLGGTLLLAWISSLAFPLVPRSADPRYYRDTGVATHLLDTWIGTLFREVPLQIGTDRAEAIRVALGELSQHSQGDAKDGSPNAVMLMRALRDSPDALSSGALKHSGLRIEMGSIFIDGIGVVLMIVLSMTMAVFVVPLPPN